MYKRSCSSLYRLPRFINCPTYITLHYITRTKKKKETDEVDEMKQQVNSKDRVMHVETRTYLLNISLNSFPP